MPQALRLHGVAQIPICAAGTRRPVRCAGRTQRFTTKGLPLNK
jgi:hypothetical protein